MSTALLGAAIAFGLAVLTTPAGVSGAVLLLPVQVSVLGVSSPSVTPTNLLYNVIATPGGLYRYWRSGALRRDLAATLLVGTLPGVVLGAALRVELLPGQRPFLLVVACVLGPLGLWLLLGSPHRAARAVPTTSLLRLLAFGVGVIGGIYGIGGGSILAPILIMLGYTVGDIAGAALLSTFVTSIAGIVTFELLSTREPGHVGPDWAVGLAVGLGGLLGSYTGARLQPHLPEEGLRRLLGALALAVSCATPGSSRPEAAGTRPGQGLPEAIPTASTRGRRSLVVPGRGPPGWRVDDIGAPVCPSARLGQASPEAL